MILEQDYIILFLLLLPLVSFLYSSVGHGGASGYLALMALFTFPTLIMKQTALLLNLFVAGIAFHEYRKAGHFTFKLFIPLALASVPAAFFGGLFELNPLLYKRILGVLLLFAILRIVWSWKESKQQRVMPVAFALLIGAVIGFFSGLIGIGGGIILTPVLLVFQWGTMKQAAAVSALFIWVNSASGLLGQFINGVQLGWDSLILILVALLGGWAGSYYGSRKFKNKTLTALLATVLFGAAIKLITV